MTQYTIKNFQEAFPHAKEFYRNLGIINTHWNFSDAEERRREGQNISKEKRKQQLNQALRKLFTDAESFEVPCFFLDCFAVETIERERQNVELEKLKSFILEKSEDPIDCRDLIDIQEERGAKEAASFKQRQFETYEPKPEATVSTQEIIQTRAASHEDIVINLPPNWPSSGYYPDHIFPSTEYYPGVHGNFLPPGYYPPGHYFPPPMMYPPPQTGYYDIIYEDYGFDDEYDDDVYYY